MSASTSSRCLVSTLILGLALVSFAAAAPKKEPRFKACKKVQPADKLNECVRDAIQRAVPELVKGLPEFGLLTIDPLRVESLDVAKGKKSAVSVDISFKNLDIRGLGNAKIRNVNLDVNKNRMSAKIDINGPITLQGDYTVNGKVLVLPIQGSGRCNITLVNPKGEITEFTYKPVMKNGKEYAHVTSLKFVVLSVERVYYDLQNLFNGNKELGDNMNLVLNDNWKEVFEDVAAPVQSALQHTVRHIFDRLVSGVPFNKILV